MRILGATRFDQSVLSMALVNLCNQTSHVGQDLQKQYNDRNGEADEPTINPWRHLHWFTIYVPHPDQEYDGISLAAGLTQGYNIESKLVENRSQIPYDIPVGAHFVTVLKQKGLNDGFGLAATGIFVRPLAVLSLDIIVDLENAEYQAIAVKHPIIRSYPSGWEQKLKLFLTKEIDYEDLPDVVGHVDQALNRDYRPPSWQEIELAAQGFAGV